MRERERERESLTRSALWSFLGEAFLRALEAAHSAREDREDGCAADEHEAARADAAVARARRETRRAAPYFSF